MPSYPVRPLKPKANLVQAFRGEMRAPAPLHPLEQALVVITSIHLCFLPWAMGARAPWAQLVSLFFALIVFTLALWPRRYVGELAPDGPFTLHTWPRLVRFPIFWLGLGFLGYIALGAINPAWERISTDLVWYIRSVEHTDWLPSSIEAPFANMNAWRMLTIYAATWLLACALWTALTRRAAVQTILTVLVVNGFILSLVAITQKMSDTKLMLWFIKVPAYYFHSTFVYKNHAGSYFNLIFVIALAVALWHHMRGLRRLERGSPAPVFAFAVVVLGACVFMSGSRAAMLLLAGFCLVSLVIYLIWRSRTRGTVASNPAISGLMTAITIVLIVAAASFLNLEKSMDQFRHLTSEYGQRESVQTRVLARNATYDLFLDQPITGWGAGSFRHAFPIYQQNYPQIFRAGPNSRQVFFWDHAHNDYVQLLAELGIIGAFFPAMAFFWLIFKLCRLGALAQPSFLVLALGLGLTLAHSWVDFPLYNPAILATFCAVWIMTVRWAELETRTNER